MDLSRLIEQKMGWAKLVGLRDEYVDFALRCVENNITPIIRIYRPQHSGVPIDPEMNAQFQSYLRAGLKWFEIYNEPNLGIEWPPGRNFDPMNTREVIAPICENWLTWAEMIINGGGYPAFIPLSESGGGWENTTTWINQLLLYMFDNHFNRFLQIIGNGFWIATHPYILNHFYQEIPGRGPLSARPPEAQNYAEPGWHFEYPYDPICQASDPGRTVWGGTPMVPLGDVHGLIACGEAWLDRLNEMFGVKSVPVVGTEGGLWPMPQRNQVHQMDTRYPGFTWESHAHATQAMFDWISQQAPPWMFGVALWKWDYYYDNPAGGYLPAVDIFSQAAPIYKTVPPLDIFDDWRGGPVAVAPPPVDIVIPPPGPGPIQGQPDYHFIFLSPSLDSAWFFEIAGPYMERFKPTLMTIIDYINFIPTSASLALTLLTTPDLVDYWNVQIARQWHNIYMDIVVITSQREVEEILNSRVASGKRFG
jgi:hypothetical protein